MSEAPRTLTREQEQAVARRFEPLLLSAAAGSGKTSVLVERFVGAVREDGVAPARILAITFTERAAGELRERVRARFLELGEREAARDTEAAFVGTFHGFCARLLRAHPLMAGLDPDFAILDEGLAGRLRERAFSLALQDFVRGERSDAVDLIAAYGVDRVHTMIAAVHAQLRSQGQTLPRLPIAALPPLRLALDGAGAEAGSDPDAVVACTLLDELLAGFGNAYEELKRARRAVDFDDLELRARTLLEERESVRASWSSRFELLMVDEFQDTNPRQLAILRALERRNLFTVGDELQSIYGFRHADVSLFRARRTELAAHGASLALTRNFRSRPELLEVVNAAFAQRFSDFTALVGGREPEGQRLGERLGDVAAAQLAFDAPLRPPSREPADGPRTELLLTARRGWEDSDVLAARLAAGLPSAPLWRQAEARMLAQRVAELIDGGAARAGEVVVLLRAAGDLDVYERALQLCGLRTLATIGGFWNHQQVADLLSYLRALVNPLDELALYSTLASPLAGLSRDGLAALARVARGGGRSAWETAAGADGGDERAGLGDSVERAGLHQLGDRDRRALAEFRAWLVAERAAAPLRSLSQLLERVIDHAGYREHVLALDAGERRLANVHKLLRIARRFEAAEGRDLRGFLNHVDHLAGAASSTEPDAPVDGVEPDAVRLMSIHAAKGLEFPVVCVADLGRAQNTRVGDLLVDSQRIGLQLLRLDGAKPTPTLEFEQLCEQRRAAETEEEDRIMYVAMTRARERLLLSGAVDFERWPEWRQGSSAISWLGPAIAPELPALAQQAQRSSIDVSVGAATVRCVLNAPWSVGELLTVGEVLVPEHEWGENALSGGTRAPSSIRPRGEDVLDRAQRAPSYVRQSGEVFDLAAQCAPSYIRTLNEKNTRRERPATFSYTALSELERCAYRYYLERVLGLVEDRAAARAPAGGTLELEARARGTLVHALLESLDFTQPLAPSSLQVGDLARSLGIRTAESEREEIAQLLGEALAGVAAARVGAALVVHREHPFAFSLGSEQPLITGVIDVLAQERDGGVLVLDYKSDRVGPDVDLEALIEREYGIQRLLYALAALRDGARSVEVVHWFLQRPHEPVGASYGAADLGRLERRAGELLADADNAMATFAVSSRPHRGLCLTCPGRASLCSWDERYTLREHPDGEPLAAAGPPEAV